MNPIIAAVDDGRQDLDRVRALLQRRYRTDYEIYCQADPQKALKQLEDWKTDRRELALILTSCWMEPISGITLLQRAQQLHPEAGRGLMIDRGDSSASKTILEAIALDSAQAYGMKPWTETDESFHRFVTRFLDDWARGNRPHFELVRLIGQRRSRRCFELRDALNRNGVAYGFYDCDSAEGESFLESVELTGTREPVAVLVDGTVLVDPSNRELAEALDLTTYLDVTGVPVDQTVDVTVVGAGPAGLSTAVYAASEGLHTVVVEREAIGGQAGMSSRIRNYLGFPTGISGSELAQRAFQQAWLFGADFTFAQSARKLTDQGNYKLLELSDGTPIRTRSVVLTLGVSYCRLGLESIDKLLGAGVFYGSPASEALAMRDHKVFVVGGGNSAGQAAVHLAKFAKKVTMVVREHSLAVNMSDYLVQEVARCGNIEVQLESEVVGGGGEGHLEYLMISDGSDRPPRRESAEALFVLIGAQPQTDWLPESISRVGNGYIVTGVDLGDQQGNLPASWQLKRRPLPFETSMPGVLAAGDVRFHAIRRVASAVGEGANAVHQLHQYLAG